MRAFKHIAVDKLPTGWEPKFFSELTNFRMGKTPPRNNDEYWDKGIYPWVSIADMEPFRAVFDTKEKVSEKAHVDVFRRVLAPADSLLMSFKLTIGRVAKLGIPAYHNEAIISFSPHKEQADPDFLFYYLAQINYRDYQDTAIKGQTLNKGKLAQLEIALPPLLEQRKIASVLGLVQRAIEQQERLIALTTELKKSLMHKLFTEGLRGERQKQTEIGTVPESWEVMTFEDFALLQRGYDLPKSQFKAGSIPVVGATTIIGYHNIANVRGPGVTVVRSGSSVGKPLFIQSDFWAHNVVLFVKDFHDHNPKFVYYKIQNLDLTKYREGVAVPTLNRNSFRTILVAVPEREEQDQFVKILDCVEQKEFHATQRRHLLSDLFRTLLHQLMTAQIRVHDLDLSFLEQEAKAG